MRWPAAGTSSGASEVVSPVKLKAHADKTLASATISIRCILTRTQVDMLLIHFSIPPFNHAFSTSDPP